MYSCRHINCGGAEAATGGVKKDVLKKFTNFTGKQLCWSLFLIKLQASGQ